MKKHAYHFGYLAIIFALLFWAFSLKSTVREMTETLVLTEGVMQISSEFLDKTSIYIKGMIDKNCDAYLNEISKKTKNDTYTVYMKTKFIKKLIKQYQDTLQDTFKGVDKNRSNSNPIILTNNMIQNLKDSILSFNESINIIDDLHHKELLSKIFRTNKFVNDITYWENFRNTSTITICNQLAALDNQISFDEISYFDYHLDRVIGEVFFDDYRVAIAPQKTSIIEGEKFKADVYLAKNVFSNYNNITFKINGKNLPIKEGLGHYELKSNKIGKNIIEAQALITNPLTGTMKSYIATFEYEVLPKCSVNCK